MSDEKKQLTEKEAQIERLKRELAFSGEPSSFENEEGFLFCRDALVRGTFHGSDALNVQLAVMWLTEQALKIIESKSNGQT